MSKKNVVVTPIRQQNLIVTPVKKVPQITDETNSNLYGVLLHTRKAIEEFQKKSGMQGKYIKEYQHHYWSAVARLNIDEQFLDISIPLVMYNYEQSVTRGDIKFDLVDVNKRSNELQKLAMTKFDELKKTKIYTYINDDLGIQDWHIIPMNTGHVHPGGENQSFSGIDLRKQGDYPGVVYPLSKGVNIPSFSCIMAHIDNLCKIVHSEYRIFIGDENKKRYIEGRSAAIVKGYEPEPLPRVKQPEPIRQKAIDEFFNLTPEQPKAIKQEEAKPMESYILRKYLDEKHGEEFLNGLKEAWESSLYEPHTAHILKKNVKQDAPMYQNRYVHQTNFSKDFDKKQGKRDGETKGTSKSSLYDKKQYLVDNGIANWLELREFPEEDILDLYELTVDAIATCDELESTSSEYDEQDFIQTYQNNAKKFKDNSKKNDSIIYFGESFNKDQIDKIRILLEEEQYLSFTKLKAMEDYDVIAYYTSFYEKNYQKGY